MIGEPVQNRYIVKLFNRSWMHSLYMGTHIIRHQLADKFYNVWIDRLEKRDSFVFCIVHSVVSTERTVT